MKAWMLLASALTWTLLPLITALLHVDTQAGCGTTANDLVYIIDGSSSLGLADFQLAKRWLVNITNSFDISSQHMQVGLVQYSDTPRLEIPLGKHLSNKELLAAIQDVGYLGGNTQTGRAIKFATQHVFASSNRTRAARNRIAVVLTDGRSQDDVVDAAQEAKAQNIILFAVGVGNEIANSELEDIANKPSSTYVLHAENYAAIMNIRDKLEQKLCEESVCPLQTTDPSHPFKGFDLLSSMKIDLKAKKVQGTLMLQPAYLLGTKQDFTDLTRSLLPEGLPRAYIFVSTLRLRSPAHKMKFDLLRILSRDGVRQVAMTLSGADRSVIFTTSSISEKEQSVIFNNRGIQRLFDTEWHQLKMLVKSGRVTCYLDGMKIEEQLLHAMAPIYIDGKIQVAKRVKMEVTVPLEIQKLRLYCDPEQNEKETACEIYSVDDERCPTGREPAVQTCNCPMGKQGLPGLPGPMGFRGEKGREGPPGPDGKPGKPGLPGLSGEPGKNGLKGDTGKPGLTGEPGGSGVRGEIGPPGNPGPPGPMGPGYDRLNMVDQEVEGPKGEPGEMGFPGSPGQPGPQGEKGEAGDPGTPGLPGALGKEGLPGQTGPTGLQGETGPPGLTGPTGDAGTEGPPGPVGPPGVEGREGSKGSPGAQGSDGQPGLPGLKGDLGQQGSMGVPGNRGLPGFKGDKADDGLPGQKGSDGQRGNDGEPGTPGMPGAVGPKGSKGERGDLGEPGVRGADGKTGIGGHVGTPGPRGIPGEDGLPGQPGVPGYPGKTGKPPSEEQLIKICANVIQTQFPQLLQLVSPSRGCHCEGQAGSPGKPGPPGLEGQSGPPGHPGPEGLRGYPGIPGQSGLQGPKGDTGGQGMKGAKGEGSIGLPGPTGPAGLQGPRGRDADGFQGSPGEPGKPGHHGSPGKRGPPGASGVCDPASCYQAYGRLREEHYSKGPYY